MIYLFQRLIQNDFQWIRPSQGRLGKYGEGEYVQKNGFGHEDWNFNHDLQIDGYLYGYCYYNPANEKKNENFNIAFSIYKNHRWYVVGFYLNSKFVDNSPINKKILEKKIKDLNDLGDSLGLDWRQLNYRAIFQKIKDQTRYLTWKVAAKDVIPTKYPILIPKDLFNPTNFRITRPTIIPDNVFNKIFTLSLKEIPNVDIEDIEDNVFPEGREIEIKHKQRERNSKVVLLAKEKFKKKNGKLFCQICNFNFSDKYGDIGIDFIEAHHTIPLSEITEVKLTKIEDIALVCSNCHRMLHRKRPWLTMKDLNNIIKK